jgi:hypothetical protein
MANGKRGWRMMPMPAGRRRRPPPTIDLAATEMAADGESPRSEAGSGDQAGSRAAPQAEQPRRAARAWRLVAAAAVGAALTVLVLGAAWRFGAFPPRHDDTSALAALAMLELQAKAIREHSARIGAAEQTLGRVEAVETRVGKLENAAPRPGAPDPALLDRVAAVEAAARSLANSAAELRRRTDDIAAVAGEAKDRADAAAEAAQKATRVETTMVDRAQVDALADRIAALERTAKTADSADRTLRLAFVAMELKAAVERGEPFATQLAAARRLNADGTALAALAPFAASGVPNAADLGRELAGLAPAMLSVAGTAPRDDGVLQRLAANAERLVRIRPIGEQSGDDPATVIGRAEAKASRGDLAGARAEIDGLPAAVRAPATQWMARAAQRLAAVEAARRLAANALDAVGKPAP